jgi:hypothetical protein
MRADGDDYFLSLLLVTVTRFLIFSLFLSLCLALHSHFSFSVDDGHCAAVLSSVAERISFRLCKIFQLETGSKAKGGIESKGG